MIKIFTLFTENKIISTFYLRRNILTEMLRKTVTQNYPRFSNTSKFPTAQLAQCLFYIIPRNLSFLRAEYRLRVKENAN